MPSLLRASHNTLLTRVSFTSFLSHPVALSQVGFTYLPTGSQVSLTLLLPLLLHLGPLLSTTHFTLKMEAAGSSETSVFYQSTTW